MNDYNFIYLFILNFLFFKQLVFEQIIQAHVESEKTQNHIQ